MRLTQKRVSLFFMVGIVKWTGACYRNPMGIKRKLLGKLGLGCLCWMLISVESCAQASGTLGDTPAATPTPSFRSGFEPSSVLTPYLGSPDILAFSGNDTSVTSGGNWDGANADPRHNALYGKMETGATTADRTMGIVADPLNPANHVLKLWLKNPTETNPVKGRVQMEIGENGGLTQASYRCRVNLAGGYDALRSYSYQTGATPDWLTLAEFWVNPDVSSSDTPLSVPPYYAEKYPFRITLYIVKSADHTQLVLGLRAERIDRGSDGNNPSTTWVTQWEQTEGSFALPTAQWFGLQVWYRQGDGGQGRFRVAVQPPGGSWQTLFDVTGWTRHPDDPSPQGLRWLNPVKIYTAKAILDQVNTAVSGRGLTVYMDDFVLWRNTWP